jgi:hypothetical protein
MFGWIISILLVIAGFITSLFISRDALNFSVVQTFIAVILFSLFVLIVAFWSNVKKWFKRYF